MPYYYSLQCHTLEQLNYNSKNTKALFNDLGKTDTPGYLISGHFVEEKGICWCFGVC